MHMWAGCGCCYHSSYKHCKLFHTQQALNKKHNLFPFFFLGLTAFSAALIYTLHNKEILQDSRELTSGHFGYCFILAWVCVPFLLCSGVIYIHLRKKEWPTKGKQCQWQYWKKEKEKEILLIRNYKKFSPSVTIAYVVIYLLRLLFMWWCF